jgi:hypothetical protein
MRGETVRHEEAQAAPPAGEGHPQHGHATSPTRLAQRIDSKRRPVGAVTAFELERDVLVPIANLRRPSAGEGPPILNVANVAVDVASERKQAARR